MEYPWLSHRSEKYKEILRAKSLFLKYVRKYLDKQDFIEVQTPKIVPGISESGANVFKLQYFDKEACLAQSPQLYKQMLINSDCGRVYEIGPIFRAENSHTKRHLCEFTGLDIEMVLDQGLAEVIEMGWKMLKYSLSCLSASFSQKLEIFEKPLILTFEEGAKLLKEVGYEQNCMEDISTVNERRLGKIVKEKYNSDLFVLSHYPTSVRPFYTKINEENPEITESFDIIFKGVEIASGAQRIDNIDELEKNLETKKVDPTTLGYYLESFKYGSWPHGGFGMGVERIISLYLDLNEVQMASFCPRTPDRLHP